MTNNSLDTVIFDPKEMLGILDLRLVGYYKIKQGMLQQNLSRYCNNYLISNCPRYTGNNSSHFTGPGKHGLEKSTSEVSWGFDKQKQRGTTDDNFRQHLFTYHISHNTVTWTSSQCIVTQDSLNISSTVCGEKKRI